MQRWAQRTILCVSFAIIFSGAAACRRAAVRQSPVPINAAANPTPQPSVCQVENLSRAALLRRTVESNAKPANEQGVAAKKAK